MKENGPSDGTKMGKILEHLRKPNIMCVYMESSSMEEACMRWRDYRSERDVADCMANTEYLDAIEPNEKKN